MNKRIFIGICLLLLILSCQKDNTIIDEQPKEQIVVDYLQNLEVLCRVWGLVKYHHPAYSVGSLRDADADLIAMIPKIRNADADTRNGLLLKWIKEFGRYESDKAKWDQYVQNLKIPWIESEPQPKEIVNLSWMKDTSILGKDLSEELLKIRYAVRIQRNKYLLKSYPNVTFLENGYANISNLTYEYRLLALFRYWNIIEYFFPAKYMTDLHWDEVLKKHIPQFGSARNELEYRTAVAQLVSEINDTHAFYDYIPLFGASYRQADNGVRFIDNRLIAYSVIAGIKPGDEIISIDGVRPLDIKATIAENFSLSNESGLLRETAMRIVGWTSKPNVTVTYVSDIGTRAEIFETKLLQGTALLSAPSSIFANLNYREPYKLIEDGTIGYVNSGFFSNEFASIMMDKFKDTKGIIIDMRNYPSSSMFQLAYGYFTSIPQIFANCGETDANTPGIVYIYGQSNVYSTNYGTYNGKVIVIVNEYTQSNGEFITMLLQTIPGCITIGSQTAGADGNISTFYLPGNIQTTISGLGVYYPDGTETQRVGIRIDEIVKPTIAGIKAGRDELYERAIELINNK